MNRTTLLFLFDLFFYICYFGRLQVSCDVTNSPQNIFKDGSYNDNYIKGTLGTANENNKNENEENSVDEDYIIIKNLHDVKNKWFENEKAKHEQNKSKTEEDLKKTEENLKKIEENLTNNNNKDVANVELPLDEAKKETGFFRAYTKNVQLENVNNTQNDQDLAKSDNINTVSAAEEKSLLEKLNDDHIELNANYLTNVKKDDASNKDLYDDKTESNYLPNMNNVPKVKDETGDTENLVNYTVKFTEDDDDLELKHITDKLKYIHKKFFDTTISCFNNVKSKLKNSFVKNKNSLKKLKSKITGTYNDIKNPNAVNVLLIQAENYLIDINSRFAAEDSFELATYISNLKRISNHIFIRLKENEEPVLNLISKINERLELTAIQLAFDEAKLEDELCIDTINTIDKYIKFIEQKSFFSIGYDSTLKRLYPTITKIESEKFKDYIDGKVEALCNSTQCVTLVCPPNSNCYNINGKEECRCFPGFAPINTEGKFECVKKDTVDCEINNGGCDKNANCLVVDNNIKCECKEGFTGDGLYCSSSPLSSSINTIVIFILCLFCLYFL